MQNATGTPTSGPHAPVIIQNVNVSPLRRFVGWLGWLGLLICAPLLLGLWTSYQQYFDTSGGIHEKYHSRDKVSRDKVAIIRIEGVIADGEGYVRKQIDRVREDEDVKAVVLRVNSPGGTISGSDYIYHHLTLLRNDRSLPIVVSMGGMAASGGYYVSMAVGDQPQSIYAEPTTTTGSIGVIVPHYDISGLLDSYHVKNDSIVSHPRKQMLSMTRPVSDEDRQVIQQYVDQAFDRFKEIVLEGRPAFRGDPDALTGLATGEIFSAPQAKAAGLVDELGFLEDAIDRAAELAQVDKDSVRVVEYEQPESLLGVLGASARVSQEHKLIETTLLELSVPKAYYLLSTLPTITASSR